MKPPVSILPFFAGILRLDCAFYRNSNRRARQLVGDLYVSSCSFWPFLIWSTLSEPLIIRGWPSWPKTRRDKPYHIRGLPFRVGKQSPLFADYGDGVRRVLVFHLDFLTIWFVCAINSGAKRRCGDRMQERMRCVQHASILLHGRLRIPIHVPSNDILQNVQSGLPHGLQLRLRRRHQHLHLRWRHLLHDRLLPHRYLNEHLRLRFG